MLKESSLEEVDKEDSVPFVTAGGDDPIAVDEELEMVAVTIEGEEFTADCSLPVLMTGGDVCQNIAQQLDVHPDAVKLSHDNAPMPIGKQLKDYGDTLTKFPIVCIINEEPEEPPAKAKVVLEFTPGGPGALAGVPEADEKQQTSANEEPGSKAWQDVSSGLDVPPGDSLAGTPVSRTPRVKSRAEWRREGESEGVPGTMRSRAGSRAGGGTMHVTPGGPGDEDINDTAIGEDPFTELDEDFDRHLADFYYRNRPLHTTARLLFGAWKQTILICDVIFAGLLAHQMSDESTFYTSALVFIAGFHCALMGWTIGLKYLLDRPHFVLPIIMLPFLSVALILMADIAISFYLLFGNLQSLCCLREAKNKNYFLESYRESRMLYQALLQDVWEIVFVFILLSNWDPQTVNGGYYIAVLFFGFTNMLNTYVSLSQAAEESVVPLKTYALYTLKVWGGVTDNVQMKEALQKDRKLVDLSRVCLGNYAYDRLLKGLLDRSRHEIEVVDISLDTISLLSKERCANLGTMLKTLDIELMISLPLKPRQDCDPVFRMFEGAENGYVRIEKFAEGLSSLPLKCAKARHLTGDGLENFCDPKVDKWANIEYVAEIRPLLQTKDKILYSEFVLPRVLQIIQPLLRLRDPRSFAKITENRKLITLLKNYQPVAPNVSSTIVKIMQPESDYVHIAQPSIEPPTPPDKRNMAFGQALEVPDQKPVNAGPGDQPAARGMPTSPDSEAAVSKASPDYPEYSGEEVIQQGASGSDVYRQSTIPREEMNALTEATCAELLVEYIEIKAMAEIIELIDQIRSGRFRTNPVISQKVGKSGNTPLHFACSQGTPEIISKVLKTCANPEEAKAIKNFDGKTPLDLARRRADISVLKALK